MTVINESLPHLVIEDPYAQITSMAPAVDMGATARLAETMQVHGICRNGTKERGLVRASFHAGLGLDDIEEPSMACNFSEMWD